jgi:transposase
VNAADAKKQRSTVQASTDRIDLLGIARMLVNKRGNCSPAQVGVYRNLRTLVRHRRRLVMLTTGVRNRIHTIVDQLFPGFLDERKSGISPFSKSSLWLMERRFSASQIRRRKRSTLVTGLRRWGTPHPERVAAHLQDYAASVLHSPVDYVSTLQLSLAQHVNHHRCLQENAEQAEKEVAVWLAQTQGAFLTSIRGIGIVLSAGVAAEIGDPTAQKPVDNLASYAGIIPRVSQTGGPEGESYTGSVRKRSNRILKDYVVQSGQHLGLHGPDELMADYRRRDANGQHAAFGMARRYLRMGMHLMRTSQVYVPARLRRKDTRPEERARYYLMMWPYLKDKWQRVDALGVAFAPEHPLGQWRHMVQEVYGIQLTW